MKIKLNQSPGWRVYFPSIVFVILLFITFWGIKTAMGLPLVDFWHQLLAYARQDSFSTYVLLLIFPWLVLGAICLSAYTWLARYFSAHAITHLFFDEKGVFLKRRKTPAPLFLPYSETDLAVCVRTLVFYNKWGDPIWNLDCFEISFTQQGQTFSVRHKAGLPFLQTILDLGTKFKSSTISVAPLTKQDELSQEEQNFIRFLKEQFENHQRYGVILTDFPRNTRAFLKGGIAFAIVSGAAWVCFIRFLLLVGWNDKMAPLLGIIPLLLLLVTGYCFKCYWVGHSAQKHLEFLKTTISTKK